MTKTKYVRCTYCNTYSDEEYTIKNKPVCKCGRKNGWTVTFLEPKKNSEWLGE